MVQDEEQLLTPGADLRTGRRFQPDVAYPGMPHRNRPATAASRGSAVEARRRCVIDQKASNTQVPVLPGQAVVHFSVVVHGQLTSCASSGTAASVRSGSWFVESSSAWGARSARRSPARRALSPSGRANSGVRFGHASNTFSSR